MLPKFDVYVPRESVVVYKLGALLPRRAYEALARLLKGDEVLAQADQTARAGYEQRAARSTAAEAERSAETEAEESVAN